MNKLKVIVLSIIAISVFTYIGAVIGYNIPRESVQAEQSKQAHIYTPEELVAEINKLRAEKGVPPLKIDERLNQSAYMAARDMQKDKYYEHVNPINKHRGNSYINEKVGNACTYVNENINDLQNFRNPVTDEQQGWVTSSSHNKEQLSQRYDTVGFSSFLVNFSYEDKDGFITSPGDMIYVAHFCDLP